MLSWAQIKLAEIMKNNLFHQAASVSYDVTKSMA